MDLTFVSAVTLVGESDFIVGGVAEITDILLAFIAVHPSAVIGCEAGVGEGFFVGSSGH